jgi:hypothetical protein
LINWRLLQPNKQTMHGEVPDADLMTSGILQSAQWHYATTQFISTTANYPKFVLEIAQQQQYQRAEGRRQREESTRLFTHQRAWLQNYTTTGPDVMEAEAIAKLSSSVGSAARTPIASVRNGGVGSAAPEMGGVRGEIGLTDDEDEVGQRSNPKTISFFP